MKIPKINGPILLVAFVLAMIGSSVWVSYLDRPENMKEIVTTEFSLSCSDVEKAGKSYLFLNIKGIRYGSSSRVKNCKELESAQFTQAVVTIRKNQDVAFGVKLDDMLVIPVRNVNSYLAMIFLIFLVFSPFFGLWVDQNRKRVNER